MNTNLFFKDFLYCKLRISLVCYKFLFLYKLLFCKFTVRKKVLKKWQIHILVNERPFNVEIDSWINDDGLCFSKSNQLLSDMQVCLPCSVSIALWSSKDI